MPFSAFHGRPLSPIKDDLRKSSLNSLSWAYLTSNNLLDWERLVTRQPCLRTILALAKLI